MVPQVSLSIRLAKPMLNFVRAHCWLGFGGPWRRNFRGCFLRFLADLSQKMSAVAAPCGHHRNTTNTAFPHVRNSARRHRSWPDYGTSAYAGGVKHPHRDGCAPPPVRIGNACPRVISFDLAQYQGLRLHGSVLPLPLAGAGRRGSTPARRAWCRNSHRCTT